MGLFSVRFVVITERSDENPKVIVMYAFISMFMLLWVLSNPIRPHIQSTDK